MFYAHFVLAKKGPLSKIWLAAHWDKKLTKAHVFETNIETSVDGILKPKVKMALRTSGHLLLGVVRIYSRKAKYLLQDCNEAFVKIKMAFRPGMVDLPEEHREAAMNAITLPEVFHDFDTAMPELNEVDIEAQFSLNQSRAEEITMREDYGSLNLVTHDDGFGDMGFDTDNPDIMREAIGSGSGLEQSNLLFADGSSLELGGGGGGKASGAGLAAPALDRRMEPAPMDDGFGGPITDVSDFGHAGGLFEGDLFGEVSASTAPPPLPTTSTEPQSLQAELGGATDPVDSDDDLPDHYDAGDSPPHSWGRSPAPELPPAEPTPQHHMEVDPVLPPPPEPEPEHDNTTLLQNDEESFALAPVDATVLKGITKTKRKRKLIVDEVKNISGEEMKNQLSNTSDIVTTLDLAPPTRRLMHWKETGGVEKLFTLPASQIPTTELFKKYQRIMSWRSEAEEGEGGAGAGAGPGAAGEARGAGGAPDLPDPPRRNTRKRKAEQMLPPEPPTPLVPDLEPPTPVPHDYEPSVGMLSSLGPPLTPGPLTPGLLQGLDHTPHHSMHPGSMTPGLGLDGGMTPGGLSHGGMTPGGLDHGGMTPAGLQHGGMTPGGLQHGGLTPAGLGHGGMTPAGLGHGGMTPAGLGHGGMTPAGLGHGGMTPMGLQHGGMTPAGAGLSGAAGVMLSSAAAPDDHHMPLSIHYPDQNGMQMTNLGYDDGHPHSPHHDYDLPASVEPEDEEGAREVGETEEQFEQRVLNRRAAQLFHSLRPRLLAATDTLSFAELAPPHHRRKQVAQKFYSLLVLKKHQVLKLEQHETYGTLTISRGVQFETETM